MLESATRFTQASQALGTPEYMAPEQAMGADADHRSDLYAFGIMIYQMLLGQTPFRADTPAATLMAHCSSAPPPTDLDRPQHRAKAGSHPPQGTGQRSRADRFQAAREMIQALALASNEVKEAAAEGDLGATAVLDIAQMEIPDPMEAATAVMDAETGVAEAAPGVGTADAGAVPAPAPGLPRWLLMAGGRRRCGDCRRCCRGRSDVEDRSDGPVGRGGADGGADAIHDPGPGGSAPGHAKVSGRVERTQAKTGRARRHY